jgi:hypothetical protein
MGLVVAYRRPGKSKTLYACSYESHRDIREDKALGEGPISVNVELVGDNLPESEFLDLIIESSGDSEIIIKER